MIAEWASKLRLQTEQDYRRRGVNPSYFYHSQTGYRHRSLPNDTGTMRDSRSSRRYRNASIDRQATVTNHARPHSCHPRLDCDCCKEDHQNVTEEKTTKARPKTAGANLSKAERPSTTAFSRPPASHSAFTGRTSSTPTSRKPAHDPRHSHVIRNARSTSSINTIGRTAVTKPNRNSWTATTSSSDNLLTPDSRYRKASPVPLTSECTNSSPTNYCKYYDDKSNGSQCDPNGKMSVTELPPILGSSSKIRPGSGRSRHSSVQSQGSRLGGSGNTGETTEIFPINGETPRSVMTKRSNRSPGSTGGSSGRGNSTGTSPRVSGNASSNDPGFRGRIKSTSDSGNLSSSALPRTDSKLETLFEQKTQPGPEGEERSRRVNDTGPMSRLMSNGVSRNTTDVFHRTKSFTNLPTDNIKNGAQNKTGPSHSQQKGRLTSLRPVLSDQAISKEAVQNNSNSGAQKVNVRRRSSHVQNDINQQKPMRISKSTPNFNSASQQTQSQSKMTAANNQVDPEVTSLNDLEFGDPVDAEKEQRIIDWLIGVENEEAERPPSPLIIEEEPIQTDTAIHVVYGE